MTTRELKKNTNNWVWFKITLKQIGFKRKFKSFKIQEKLFNFFYDAVTRQKYFKIGDIHWENIFIFSRIMCQNFKKIVDYALKLCTLFSFT